MKKITKIVLISLLNNNLGDSIIAECTKYLLKSTNNNIKIIPLNLFPNKEIMMEYKKSYKEYTNWLDANIHSEYLKSVFKFFHWWKYQKRRTKIYEYYRNTLKKADLVVFAGGGLIKYTREDFWNPIYSIITYCNRKKIPVYINAIGVEGFKHNNFYCQLLKYSLNKKCVKRITTRDDIETLKTKYIKDSKKTALVGDSALWSPNVYNIEEIPIDKKQIIGIGLIRGKIFTDYGFNISEDEIINLYIGIIKELEKRNYKWQMFCNGIKSDYLIGQKILENLNLENIDNIYLAKRPTKSKKLINLITSYKAIIAARLHAIIVAVSYNIPAVGLVWNDKLTEFGEIMNISNRFIEKDKFRDSVYIVDQLEESIRNNYKHSPIEEYKSKTRMDLENFIKSYRKEIEYAKD